MNYVGSTQPESTGGPLNIVAAKPAVKPVIAKK
jgi:hypothetical protein